jgi:hypothetical protein
MLTVTDVNRSHRCVEHESEQHGKWTWEEHWSKGEDEQNIKISLYPISGLVIREEFHTNILFSLVLPYDA